MMPASKHFDLVLGIDFHLVLPPGSSTPVLLPHPFIGFVFDVLDYIPYFSNGLKINGVPSATAGSVGLNFPHQPSGGGSFVKEIENDCVLFMGSSKTYVAGSPLSYMGLPVLSCQCVGIAKPAQSMQDNGKAESGLYLPTSVVLSIPFGNQVLISGPPTISTNTLVSKVGLKFGKQFLQATGAMNWINQQLQSAKSWFADLTGTTAPPDSLKGFNEEGKVEPVPLLVNESNEAIYYKPEEGTDAIRLPPRSSVRTEFDGVSTPERCDEVFKVSNGTSVHVDKNYGVNTANSTVKGNLGNIWDGGWKDRDWQKDLHNTNGGDHGWDKLFDKSEEICED